MKEQELVKAFCQGYAMALVEERTFKGEDVSSVDDWLDWDKYNINLYGSYYSQKTTSDYQLQVEVYPRGWADKLPAPLFNFVVDGENK